MRKVTAKRVVLDTVSVTLEDIPAWKLDRVGAVFGFNKNSIRVALTRLCASGHCENNGEGGYRLGPQAKALGAHVDRWQLGEGRRRPWKGGFLAVSLPPRSDRTARRRSQAALGRLGFVEGLSGLYIRPDNLRQTRSKTADQLTDLGLESAAVLFVANDFDEQVIKRELAPLWPVRELERGYRGCLKDLRASLERLVNLERREALLQLSSLGDRAMRVLASDPLLPEEMMPSRTREELTELTIEYQNVASKRWHAFLHAPELQLIEGGRNAG